MSGGDSTPRPPVERCADCGGPALGGQCLTYVHRDTQTTASPIGNSKRPK